MKYLFVTGAPGSKWSSVVKNIYFSTSIDQTDHTTERTYYKNETLMHLGAYWDPGMEFGNELVLRMPMYDKEVHESEFDKPFNGNGLRIIKSHVFSKHIDYLKETWPDCKIVLVHRSTDSALGWWIRAGQFNITYPNYKPYYKDIDTVTKLIEEQNKAIEIAWDKYSGFEPSNNIELCEFLEISLPNNQYRQIYKDNDITVKVI
jgi:hypothetical protein